MNNSNHSKIIFSAFFIFYAPHYYKNPFLPLLHKYRKVHKSNTHKNPVLSHCHCSKCSLCFCIDFLQLPCHSSPFVFFTKIMFLQIPKANTFNTHEIFHIKQLSFLEYRKPLLFNAFLTGSIGYFSCGIFIVIYFISFPTF